MCTIKGMNTHVVHIIQYLIQQSNINGSKLYAQ